jgi:hypothetical protein
MDLDKAFILKFGSQITVASAGTMSVDKSSIAAVDRWFPSIKVDGMSMNGWFIVMKYRPHLSGNSLDKQMRCNVELEVRQDGGGVGRHPKMMAKVVPPIIVNEVKDSDEYAYAHIPLTTPLRLDVPFEDQREVFKEIVEHTKTLTGWYRKAILNVDF